MEELQFEEEGHFYTLNGRRLVSVTQALSLVDDRRAVDPWYLERGTYVHRACEFYDRDELDLETVDPAIQGYVTAWTTFRQDSGFTPDCVEVRLYHPRHRYAGTVDRIGTLNGLDVIIDIKSGAPARVDELQGAAYWELARVNSIPVKKAFDLYLRDDGTYKLQPIENPKSLLYTFLAILTAYRWKEKIG
jgi:hypothetical protein